MDLQIFVQSPDPQIASQTLTLTPTQILTQTLHHLKLSFLPDPLAKSLSSSFYFTLNGKPLADSTPLESPRIAPLSTLVLRQRLPGGGGDGGATGAESRDCYLKMYAERKPDKVDPNEQKLSKSANCALSNEPLRQPCVIDRLGNVFNKEALVEALLGKKLPKEFGYIKGLKDMINVKFSRVPGAVESDKNAVTGTRFQCPVTGLEFNGKYRFLALRNCGHVLSAKALKEVKSSACLVCHEEFQESDKIMINGSEDEVTLLRERMLEEKGKVREKKVKKVKNGEGEVGANGEESVGLQVSRLSGTKHGIHVNATAEKMVSGKLEGNGKIASGGVGVNGAAKRFKAADLTPANATKEVYASIFTSSKKSNFKETYSCRSLPLGRN